MLLLTAMTLVNLTVQGSHRRYIPWTVIEVLSGQTFSGLFEEILAGGHPRLIVDEELSRCTLNTVYVGMYYSAGYEDILCYFYGPSYTPSCLHFVLFKYVGNVTCFL